MLHPLEIPTLDVTAPCADCEQYRLRLSALMKKRDAQLEEAFESTDVAEIEQSFTLNYSMTFREWMDHRMTHETGSLRRYVLMLASS